MEFRLLRYFVAVAQERHFGRAALRLHMTQPPLSRAIRQLEADLGVVLLHRSTTGVELTAAGTTLYAEARTLLAQAEQARARVRTAACTTTLTVGTLIDSVGTHLAEVFRRHHPDVSIHFREADFTDPTTGLRTGLVDVALTRAPFDSTGISTRLLRSDPVGAVLRTDDPLAHHDTLRLADLADRAWVQLPEDTDPAWRAYWNGATPPGQRPAGHVARTVHECLQAVLWNGTVGIAPLNHTMPDGLTVIPLSDMPPSAVVVAWETARTTPLIDSFARIAVDTYRAR